MRDSTPRASSRRRVCVKSTRISFDYRIPGSYLGSLTSFRSRGTTFSRCSTSRVCLSSSGLRDSAPD